MPNQEKIKAVAEMKELFDSSDSFFITDYQGLDVADMTSLRSSLRDNNVKYIIAKNTLLRIAAKEAGYEGLDTHLTGPTAIAFTSDDAAAAAKVLHDFFKDKKLPVMKAFLVDKELFAGDEIKRLADLPTKDTLLAMVVASVEAPFTSLIGSLDGFFRELVGSIDALEEKKKGEA